MKLINKIRTKVSDFIYKRAYPNFKCEDCTTTELGCECSYRGFSAPNKPATRTTRFYRGLYDILYGDIT